LDIDLALNPASIPTDAYETILEILHQRGYEPKLNSIGEVVPASYIRTYTDNDGHKHAVQVDLLSPEYSGTDPAHRHQPVQDILARKGRGVDLAFASPVEKRLEGYLPSKEKMQLPCALPMPSLALR
jgi:stress-induced morphogen